MTYPDDWKYQEQPNPDSDTLLLVQFSNNFQTPDVSLWVEMKNNTRQITNDQDYLAELAAENKNSCDTFKSNGNSCYYSSLDDSKIISINGLKAYQIRFSWYGIDSTKVTHPDTSIVTEIPSDTNTWTIESSTSQALYPTYNAKIQSVIQSFSLLSKTPNTIPNNPPNPEPIQNPSQTVQQDSLTISTDKSSYTDGDKIVISGQVGQAISGFPVVIRIQTPNGNLLSMQQVTVTPNGFYSTAISAGGNSWLEEGTYTIFAQYGTKNISTQTTFDFKKTISPTTSPAQPSEQSPAGPQAPTTSLSMPEIGHLLAGQNLFIILGVVVALVAGIVIYLASKSKSHPPSKSGEVKDSRPPEIIRSTDSRYLVLKNKPVLIDIRVQYPNRNSSGAWNYGTDRKIGSGTGGGYLLVVSLKEKNKSFMEQIVEVLENHGFDGLLVNFEKHHCFRSSQDLSETRASQFLSEISDDLEIKFGNKKPKPAEPSKRVDHEETNEELENEKRDRHNEKIAEEEIYKKFLDEQRKHATEPPKVEPRYRSEHVHTGTGPFVDGRYSEFGEPRKDPDYGRENARETEEVKSQQEAARERRKIEEERRKREESDDPYQVLGVSPTSSCEEVKAKFKELIRNNNMSGIIHMSIEEKERMEAMMRKIIKAKEELFKMKGCKR